LARWGPGGEGAARDSGSCGNAIRPGALTRSLRRNGAGARRFLPPWQRAQLERVACTDPAASGLQLARWDCRSRQEGAVAQAIVGAVHHTTVARGLAQASLQPRRRRYWKTATVDERFGTQAAKLVGRSERVEGLDDRGEVVRCVAEKPPLQVLVRRVPTPPRRPGQIARRAFEDTRAGTVTFLAALNVYDGSMWGGLEANDHAQCLGALRRLARH